MGGWKRLLAAGAVLAIVFIFVLAESVTRPRLADIYELAGRLLGFPRVGLGILVETVLGYTLEKGHAAVDWSTRPLPPSGERRTARMRLWLVSVMKSRPSPGACTSRCGRWARPSRRTSSPRRCSSPSTAACSPSCAARTTRSASGSGFPLVLPPQCVAPPQ